MFSKILRDNTNLHVLIHTGYMDPKRTIGWSIIDFDWSNGKVRIRTLSKR